jgi:hypothetical protein
VSGGHTPGPWAAARINASSVNVIPDRIHGFKAQVVAGDRGDMVAHAFGRTADEADANARLIAAAPELLEALQYVVCQLADGDEPELDGDGDEIDPFERARTAIAKATGAS